MRAVFALPGYWLATALALIWGAPLARFRVARHGDLLVCAGLPRWAFGRGGTTIGAVYLTRGTVSEAVLRHEAVHRQQWRRYGLAFIVLYFAAGLDPLRNRFEIEVLSGLEIEEQLVVEGFETLRNRSKVKITNAAAGAR